MNIMQLKERIVTPDGELLEADTILIRQPDGTLVTATGEPVPEEVKVEPLTQGVTKFTLNDLFGALTAARNQAEALRNALGEHADYLELQQQLTTAKDALRQFKEADAACQAHAEAAERVEYLKAAFASSASRLKELFPDLAAREVAGVTAFRTLYEVTPGMEEEAALDLGHLIRFSPLFSDVLVVDEEALTKHIRAGHIDPVTMPWLQRVIKASVSNGTTE